MQNLPNNIALTLSSSYYSHYSHSWVCCQVLYTFQGGCFTALEKAGVHLFLTVSGINQEQINAAG